MRHEIDIFCEVIDNFGDVGVVYRLGKLLSCEHSVRIFIDSLKELKLLNPKCDDGMGRQEFDGLEFVTFNHLAEHGDEIEPREIIIEAFGCNLNEKYLEKAKSSSSLLINLEYLSSEEWTVGFHGNESMMGAKKLRKFFFVPGLLEGTGGVIFDRERIEKMKALSQEEKENLLDRYLSDFPRELRAGKRIGTLFSYEKNFINLLETLNSLEEETILLVMGERSWNSMKRLIELLKEIESDNWNAVEAWEEKSEREKKELKEKLKKYSKDLFNKDGKLELEEREGKNFRLGKCWINYYPFIPQEDYDELIMLTDFNLVRGEDSFVRAALSGVPFLWHIYLQDEKVHLEKLQSFLEVYKEFFQKRYTGKYNKVLKDYEKIMMQYNDRDENSLKVCHEDFNLFFGNLGILKEMGEIFSEHIIKNHDLIDKLNRFIDEKML